MLLSEFLRNIAGKTLFQATIRDKKSEKFSLVHSRITMNKFPKQQIVLRFAPLNINQLTNQLIIDERTVTEVAFDLPHIPGHSPLPDNLEINVSHAIHLIGQIQGDLQFTPSVQSSEGSIPEGAGALEGSEESSETSKASSGDHSVSSEKSPEESPPSDSINSDEKS